MSGFCLLYIGLEINICFASTRCLLRNQGVSFISKILNIINVLGLGTDAMRWLKSGIFIKCFVTAESLVPLLYSMYRKRWG